MAYLGDLNIIVDTKFGIMWRILTSRIAICFYAIFKVKSKIYKSWLRHFMKVNIAGRGWERMKMPTWNNYR